MTPFWYRWPSIFTELLAGVLLASVVQVLPFFAWRLIVALWLSWVYETFIDARAGELGHNAFRDQVQRAGGILLGLLLWGLL
jgi:hypothetical protein